MTLSFTTKINGTPNFFVEKIWIGLIQYQFSDYSTCNKYQKAHIEKFMQLWDYDPEANLIKRPFPKLHTIREDVNDNWKPGIQIHFVINNRSKNRFQFAPVLPAISCQRIIIVSDGSKTKRSYQVWIDGKILPNYDIERLAINDGFKSSNEFFSYFCKYDGTGLYVEYTGKVIHWTNIKY